MEPLTPFDVAFNFTVGQEGGFSKDPNDPGNWTSGIVNQGTLLGTKYGIAANSYPKLDIANLTLDDAKAIYKKDYWDKLPATLAPKAAGVVFDQAVNSGISRAIKILQATVGTPADGVWGPKSDSALLNYDQTNFTAKYCSTCILFYTSLSTFSIYGKGWMNRISKRLQEF